MRQQVNKLLERNYVETKTTLQVWRRICSFVDTEESVKEAGGMIDDKGVDNEYWHQWQVLWTGEIGTTGEKTNNWLQERRETKVMRKID